MGEQARNDDEFQALVDIHIDNNGTLDDLRKVVAMVFKHQLKKPSPAEAESHLVQTDLWGEAPEELRLLAEAEVQQGVPTAIAYIPGHGWFGVQTSGQGPYFIWPG